MRREGTAGHRPDIPTAQLIAEYRAGDSTRTIGKRYGISHATVAYRLRRLGVLRKRGPVLKLRAAPQKRRRKPPQALIDQIVAGYQAGATLRGLGERYHYSHTSIKDILEAAGVPRRHRWSRKLAQK